MTAPNEDGTQDIAGQEPTEVTLEVVEETKTFNQSEVDAIVKDRLKRERTKIEKAATDKLEAVRVAGLSENEKLIEEAKSSARAEIRREYATDLAAAEIRAALTGVVNDPDEVIDDLNLNKFVDSDDQPNQEAIAALKAKYTALLDGRRHKNTATLSPGASSSTMSTKTPKDAFANFIDTALHNR